MYACPICCSRLSPLRNGTNTRYGWAANPYPTGTSTQQETPSFARRDSVNAGLDQAVFARVPDGMTCVAVPCNRIDMQQRAALPIPQAQGPVVPGVEQPPAVWGEGAGPHPALVAGQGAQCRRRWWVGETAMRGTWWDDGLRARTGAPGGGPRGPGTRVCSTPCDDRQ